MEIALLVLWLLAVDSGRACRCVRAADAAVAPVGGAVLRTLPPQPRRHVEDEAGRRALVDPAQQARYERFQTERATADWFAALVATDPPEAWTVKGRFRTWGGLMDFLQEQDALVETWAYAQDGAVGRRVTAAEVGQWRARGDRRPAQVTVVYRDPDRGVVTNRLELGFNAAALSLATLQNHARHRQLQRAATRILAARAGDGQLNAQAQWTALEQARLGAVFPIETMPPRGDDERDLLTAFEYETDAEGNYARPLRAWRESEIEPWVLAGVPRLLLGGRGQGARREAVGFRRRGVSDEWEPVAQPIPGQDMVELRIRDPQEPDPRRWHGLEFGEPELIRQAALSQFALLAAHLERQRKAVAVKRANLALVAEPIIAGVNVGGGLAGLGFPAGEVVRLAYNVAVTPLLTRTPTAQQMRELFVLMAARDRDSDLRTRPAEYLSRDDIRRLREAGSRLSAEEVRSYLDRMKPGDVEAMLKVAQQAALDDRVTYFLNLVTSVLIITGASEQEGILQELFNSVYFSLSGDINVSTIFLVAIGRSDLTPLSGVSLESLAHGEAPAEAWAQYFTLSVDFRAIVNTVARWTKPDLAGKELEKPFPYSPHLGDLAAYEFRAFGFPFLMFYKRGLTRADARAYEEDYAYGLLGPRVVEHFRTREELDAEVRAGRMTPLGFVRVRDGWGGWRSTHLAVFAHRIPQGKHHHRTAIVVYGLKAYEQGSAEVVRALDRFRLYERVQAEGGMIEQVVRAQGDVGLRAQDFEPVVRPGTAAVEEGYAPVLAELVELRRIHQRRAWGIASAANEETEEHALRERLAARGFELVPSDPHFEVDGYSSSFIARRLVDGAWQDVKWVQVPAPDALERDQAALADAVQVDLARRRVAAGELPAVVLLNTAVRAPDGQWEAGPLLRSVTGDLLGTGVIAEADAVNRFLDRLAELPVTDQARLRFNRYAGTLLEMDPHGAGAATRLFVTIEFAPRQLRRERVHPLTGEREVLMYERGLWREAITDRRILELDYDGEGLETSSRTYANRGSRRAPVRGDLIEETRTLDVWLRDLGQPGVDPYAPLIAKLRVNHVTGELIHETYGLFLLPVATSDSQFVTRNLFDRHGRLASASLFENVAARAPDWDPTRSGLSGRARFELHALPDLAGAGVAAGTAVHQVIRRTDLDRGVVRTQIFDPGSFGRMVGESYTDPFDGTRAFALSVEREYRDDFYHGLIPVRSVTRGGPGRTVLSEVKVVTHDPATRRLTGVQVDYTGKRSTNRWDFRWENPVEVSTALRQTVVTFDDDGNRLRAFTRGQSSGEEISQTEGRYNAAARQYEVTRRHWHRPGVPAAVEHAALSPLGKLMTTRWGDGIEVRPIYDDDGREVGRRTLARRNADGPFDLLVREEGAFHWNNGRRAARVTTFLEGRPYDTFDLEADEEGRVTVDGRRDAAGVVWRTLIAHEGDTDRMVRAEVQQNGQRRSLFEPLAERLEDGGRWVLPVRVTPAWGLVETNAYLLGDPFARLLSGVAENGDRVRVVEWFEGSAVDRVTETLDRYGRVKERRVREVAPGTVAERSADRVTINGVGPGGEPGWRETQTCERGTGRVLFADTADLRVVYDPHQAFAAPLYRLDPHGASGGFVEVAGVVRSNVVTVFRASFSDWPARGAPGVEPERVLELQAVDFRDALYARLEEQVRDRSGQLLEVRQARLSIWPGSQARADQILAGLSRATPLERVEYRFAPGWCLLETNRNGLGPTVSFSARTLPAEAKAWPVNDQSWREWPTEILVTRPRGLGTSTDPADFVPAQRLSAPRRLHAHPVYTGVGGAWTAWSGEHLRGHGEPPVSFDVVLSEAGERSFSLIRKQNRAGRSAPRVAYRLTEPLASLAPVHPFPVSGVGVWTTNCQAADADFVAIVFPDHPQPLPRIEFRDAAGSTVTLAAGRPMGGRTVSPWPLVPAATWWWPDRIRPEYGASLGAAPAFVARHGVVAVAMADLAAAGLDLRGPLTVTVAADAADRGLAQVCGPVVFGSGVRPGGAAHAPAETITTELHSSGLLVTAWEHTAPAAEDRRIGRHWRASASLGGREVIRLQAAEKSPHEPVAVILDPTAPDAARPLYMVAATDGTWQRYHDARSDGDTAVFTVAGGLEAPVLGTHRTGILEDETAPGLLTFGVGHPMSVTMARGGRGWRNAYADLRNRWAASVFALAAQPWIGLAGRHHQARRTFEQLSRRHETAAAQAEWIGALPPLATALLPRRPLPWSERPQTIGERSPEASGPRALGEWLRQASVLHTNTSLIATAPASPTEHLVDTVEECRLIQLAVRLQEHSLAHELLAFYYQKTRGGRNPVHSSYDANSGAPLVRHPRHVRPVEAERSAAAQVALAEAALGVAVATRDSKAVDFARRLTELLLTHYRLATRRVGPRGLTEARTQAAVQGTAVTYWPAPARYSVQTNVRGLQLLRQWLSLAGSLSLPEDWQAAVRAAAGEQSAWLTNHVVPSLRRFGVPPQGVFEVQDVAGSTTAQAPERMTAAADWLALLEVADALDLSPAEARLGLENLARVHGVWIGPVWGLDWSLALVRPDAISPALTARFARVADQLGHAEAAAFARLQLARLRQGAHWPAAVTARPPTNALVLRADHAIPPVAGSGTGTPSAWPLAPATHLDVMAANQPLDVPVPHSLQVEVPAERDFTSFLWTTAAFYLALVAVTLSWWTLGAWRRHQRRRAPVAGAGSLVSPAVMARAEERWATRVLGALPVAGSEHSRFSNSPTEPNFHMQLRAIYKLTLEYRRLANGWSETGRELVTDDRDEWLNGLDEFAAMVGLYARYVVKAGRKDGRRRAEVFETNEDSNHLWSRLVCYFSEFHLELLTLLRQYRANPVAADLAGVPGQIEAVLQALGVRPRLEPFDARQAFNAPGDPAALDPLLIQLPGATLSQLADEMETRLKLPKDHFAAFLKRYLDFKEREDLYPVHPYLLEAAKLLPHFLFMGLAALIWYNLEHDGLPLYPYLRDTALDLLREPRSLVWALPLGLGFLLSAAAHALAIYRYRYRVRSHAATAMWLDTTLTSFFTKGARPAEPAMRESGWWNPLRYRRWGWSLRAFGLLWLAVTLWRLPSPSFAIFMFVDGFVALFLFVEAAAIGLPLAISHLVLGLEDRATLKPTAWPLTRWLSRLNLVATRPASLVWTSLKYHFQPSVPSGGPASVAQSIVFYLMFAAAFFCFGGYLYKEALQVWFRDTYHLGRDLGLLMGTALLWSTMYLLRFGLFVLFATVASALVTYPLKTAVGLAALAYAALLVADNSVASFCTSHPWLTHALALAAVGLALAEPGIVRFVQRSRAAGARGFRDRAAEERALAALRADPDRAFGIVYMSGDDLSSLRLTPELLMARVRLLRDKLDSGGLRLLGELMPWPDDAALEARFRALHEAERSAGVTLWHPCQLVVPGAPPGLDPALGLGIAVADEAERATLLAAWHLRRWVVTMMSTAGHAQDTGINLVDLALRVRRDGLAGNAVFYLIQNKYDDADHNRPVQAAYDRGELGQRNTLARLLMAVAPGCRAHSLNDWTPFGFKAGGMVGMDLVHEECLRLTHMVVLDRNANVHDLDAFMADLRMALADPSVVIVIPGRGTTNTLTPIGQASRAIEEGNRALLKGVTLLGGESAESLGTGWGNIQAVYYGRVQRALCDPTTPLMPLTTRAGRGASFADRTEGLIGFGPHAVGISEDIWGVTQAAHNAVGLGLGVRFRRSQALWHKLRETWSHAEWFQAFPRWSGGYVQMMLDPLMQRVNDGGPLSVFAKEIRANGGRFFLSAPVALLTLLLMPLAIIAEVSPFVKILILLWNFGLIMNQVLAGLGLLACLESTGFNRIAAIGGAALAGGLGVGIPGVRPWLPALVPLGALAAGFAQGLGRWAYHRGRDGVLFGPQLVIHVLGQTVRQSLEFVLSGASANDAQAVNIAFRAWVGPREDRPYERYANLVNLRTVVWGVGLAAFLLNLFALAQLDFLNVLLLLPTLLFSVSCLLGPFLLQPTVGRPLGRWTWAPRLAGWTLGFGFYLATVAALMRGGWSKAVAATLAVACLGWLLAIGLRYVNYPRRLRRLTQELARRVALAGAAPAAVAELTHQVTHNPGRDDAQTQALFHRAGLAPAATAELVGFIAGTLRPWLRRPLTDLQRTGRANHRFVSEMGRSFVLALGTLIWFLLVPVPGLLVVQAPAGYQISVPLGALLLTVGGVVGLALVGLGWSTVLDAWQTRGARSRSLTGQAAAAWERLQRLGRSGGKLGAQDLSSAYALFTDLQSYVDQRSLAYARRALGLINEMLTNAERR